MNNLNTTLAEYIELVDSGKLCINDVRHAYHLPPIEGGDVYGTLTETGFVPQGGLPKTSLTTDEMGV
jgi:hypothetical protein